MPFCASMCNAYPRIVHGVNFGGVNSGDLPRDHFWHLLNYHPAGQAKSHGFCQKVVGPKRAFSAVVLIALDITQSQLRN